ncbi:MAG: complex I NDUFA9 subunit family protein [Chloroflexi bacterium]|jgi:NADH dehydrogenase|nr:complex I NDUFA9 subunit family protein [Chloroflexota bacterium]
MSTVLVTGASGFVGSHVIPELVGGGHRVVALVRSPKAGEVVHGRLPAAFAANVELRTGDVLAPGTLAAALAGVDAVVHLVALPRDWNGGKDLLRVNLGGTQSLIAAMETAGVRRLVHLGALGVEDREELHYAKSKARAEAAVRASALDWTILKPSLLFGPRDGFFNIVADLVRIPFPVVPVPGNGKSRFQPMHVGDVALGMRLALERPETIGQAFELGGPRVWTYREITEEVARSLGKRRLVLPMPVPLIRLVAGTMETLRLRFFPVATDQLRQLALDNVGPLDGVHRAFGFVPRKMEGELLYLRDPKKRQEPAPAVRGG